MRILFTSARAPWDRDAGGGQVATDDLATSLVRIGVRVAAVYPTRHTRDTGYQVVTVTPRRRTVSQAMSVALAVTYLRLRSRWLISTSGYEGGLLPPGTLRVAVCHHPSLPCWEAPSRTSPYQYLRYAYSHAATGLELRSLRRAAAVVFVSDWARTRAQAALHLGNATHVVRNGVDTSRFSAPARRTTGPLRVVFVGRFDEQKGIDVLLTAWRAVEDRAQLHLYGAGWQEGEYRELAARLALRGVSFQGKVERGAMPAILQQADALCLPSRYENLPLAILEAMACAVPVIATRVGGIPEVVVDGRNGLLVEPNDVSALGRALSLVVDDATLRHRLGTSAAETIRQRFTLEQVRDSMLRIFEAVDGGYSADG